jgi:hypothetical protein
MARNQHKNQLLDIRCRKAVGASLARAVPVIHRGATSGFA